MIRVRLFDGPTYWMTHFAEADGAVYLDLDEEFQIQIDKEIEQQTSINKINVEAVLGTSIVATPKNEALIGKPTALAVQHNGYTDFKVQVMKGMKILNQSTLRVLSKKEGEKGTHYEVEILDTTNHWAVKLNEIYLDDLAFNKFDYTPENLWLNFNNGAKYDDGEDGYHFPLVNYGLWTGEDSFTISDFRPWVHALKVLQLAFCQAGWQFSCPVLETDLGRRLITYVLKERYNEDEALKNQRKFKAGLSKPITMPTVTNKPIYYVIPFDDELEDPGNSYDPTTGIYEGVIYAEFTAEIYVDAVWEDARPGSARFSVIFTIIHEYADGRIFEIDPREAKYEKFNEKNYRFTCNGNIFLKPGDKVYVRFRGDGDGPNHIVVKDSSTFYCTPTAYLQQEGDSFDVKKALRHDKVIEYLKGIDHLFNFKYVTNFWERKVYILTPYDADFFGDSVSGFFQETLEDWTDYIDMSDSEVVVPQSEKKNLYFKFKKSTDPHIDKLKLDEDKELFSNYIDNGYDFKDATENFENPYFEPTLNGVATGHGIKRAIYDIPYCLDNLSGDLSFNIGPRILIARGMTDQLINSKTIPAAINYFDYRNAYQLPYAYQEGNAFVSITGTRPNEVYVLPDEYLVYGKKEFDLYNLFYKKYQNEFRNCHRLNLNTFANENKIESIDFRKRIQLTHRGTTQYGRFLSIEAYDLGEETGKIIFKPDNTSDPACSTYTPINPCNNYPEIVVTPTGGGNYNISASGSNASPVASTVIEWKYWDATTWTAGSTFNTTDKKVYARITWTYSDGCTSIQKSQPVEPCGNYPKLCYERVLPEPATLSVYECGVHADVVTGHLYEYSTNNIAWQVIPDPFLLSDLPDTVWLRVTVYYQNCPPLTATGIYSNKSRVADCTYDGIYTPTVIFVHTLGGLYLERKGSYTGKVAMDVIWFRVAGSTDEWDLYDDKNPELLDTGSGVNWEAKRTIFFCDGDCPTYCSEIVTAKTSCGGAVEVSDSSQLCDFELKWENPDTPGSNTWKATLNSDTDYVIPTLRVWMEQDCGGTITELYERTVQWERWNYKTQFSWTWAQDDTVQFLKISRNVAGVQTLAQTVNVGVKFNSGMTNDQLKGELENAIRLEMTNLFNAIDGIDYDMIITITGSGASRTATVAFAAKDVTASTWFGPNKGVDYLRTITPALATTDHTSTGAEFQKVTTSAPIVTMKSPCGTELKVRLKVNTGTQFIDDSASNFDNIVLNSPIAVTHDVLTVLTDSCNKHDLSVTLTGCSSPTYMWKRGNLILGTTATMISWGDKKIQVFVTCNDGCTYMAETIV